MNRDIRRDIRRLVRLQEIAHQMKDFVEAERTLPQRTLVLDQQFRQTVEEIGAARLRHENLVQQQQRLHRERDETQDRLRVAQQKLMQVSNQREYSAVLMEIDTLKAGLAALEQRAIQTDEEIEQLAGPAAEADAQVEAERAKFDEEKRKLAEDIARNADYLAQLRAQQDEIARDLPPEMLRRFESVAKARGGVAVARIEKESCAACHVRLRPQVINLVRRGEEVVSCDSCRRMLYVDDNEGADAGHGGPGVGAVNQ